MCTPLHRSVLYSAQKSFLNFVLIYKNILKATALRGGARNFPTGGLTLPMRGLKYGFQGTINAEKLRKIAFYLPTQGLACSDGEAIAP